MKSPVIVCGGRRYRRRYRTCRCGNVETRMCDWRTGRTTTCDAALCDDCTVSPAPGKDLCEQHAEIWKKHPKNVERNPDSGD